VHGLEGDALDDAAGLCHCIEDIPGTVREEYQRPLVVILEEQGSSGKLRGPKQTGHGGWVVCA
jgi:hypothetical protein